MTQADTTTRTQIDRAAVEALSARLNEPDWVLKRRLEAWAAFEEAPMPDPLDEEWRRIDTEKLSLDGIAPCVPVSADVTAPSSLPDSLRTVWDEEEDLAGRVIQLDSDVVHTSLDEDAAAKGVIVTDLHTAAAEHPEILREKLATAVRPQEWKYLALQAALRSGGCLVYVPEGVEIELPVKYGIGLASAQAGLFPHLLLVAEANSRVTVIQEGISADQPGLVSGAVEVLAGPGANVRFVDVQRWGYGMQNFATMRALLEKDATFQSILLGLGGSITKSRLDVKMQGDGSNTELLGLFFGDRDQQFDYDTRQDHVGARTESDLLFKSVLSDSAALTWHGVVDVQPSASQSAANQTSRNLLLSDKASAAPTPILEISAHDVASCSHGATVGPVDEEQIFYLQARGIPADVAEQMLVDGFFAEVLERVPSERMQERVRAVLDTKLGR